ncbi:MAG: hypothetical protein QXT77_08245 [Candidatus Methanomethylicaceae archaeon]
MLALGAPPKLYLWFLLGPGLYAVFLNWRVESAGNLYRIGARIMPQHGVQELVQSVAPETTGSISVGGLPWVTWDDQAEVSAIFAMIDSVVSNGVQAIVAGVTPVKEVGSANLNYESFWWIMGDVRWRLLEAITSARLNQADLRDLLITFWSSECGGALRKYLSMPRYMAARNAKNSLPPPSVFDGQPGDIAVRLSSVTTPTPLSMRSLFGDIFRRNEANASVNFQNFSFQLSALGQSNFVELAQQTGQIKCHDFLKIVIAGIRAEAGYNFAKLMAQAPITVPRFTVRGNDNFLLDLGLTLLKPEGVGPLTPKELGRELFASWNLSSLTKSSHSLPIGSGTKFGPIEINFSPGKNDPFSPLYDIISVNITERDDVWVQRFVDIITAYIFKNELAFAPPLLHDSVGDANSYTQAATASVASVGATSKFGEIYIWAQMLPKVQGLFLYWLAVGFPLAVILMVVPNFHKALITWTLFWTWVKSWDIGFTLIKRVEPVLWSLVGKSDLLEAVMDRVLKFGEWSKVGVICVNNAGVGSTFPPCGASLVPLTIVRGAEPNLPMSVEEVVRTFDLGLAVHNSLWLEEGNAFYLYLLAAMYFAVPVIMGQLILGSKAAMANLVKDFTGQIASDGSRAAGQAYSAQRQAQASATAASFNQAEMLKNMREQGLAERAIQAQNLSLRNQVDSALKGQIAQGIRTQAEMASLGLEASQRLSQGLINRQLWPVIVGGNQARQAGMGAVGATSQMMWIDNLVRRVALSGEQAQPVSVEDYAQLFSDNVLNPTEAIKDTATTVMRLAIADQGYQAQTMGRATGMGTAQNLTRAGTRAGNGSNGSNNSLPLGDPSQGSPVSPFTAAGEARLQPHRFVTSPTGVIPNQPQPNHVTQSSGRGLSNSDGSLMADASSMTDGATPGWGRIAGAVQQQVFFYMNAAQQLYSLPRDQGISLLGAEIADRRAHATALGQSLGIESFRHSQDSAAFGQTSQRVSAAANFEAQSSTWLARANYANAVAATLSAYGVSPQTVSPGEKPTEYMGAAWLGQLGSSANDQAHYVDNNNMFGVFQEIRRDTAGLISNYSDIRMYETFLNSRMNPDTLMGLGLTSLMSEQGMMDTQIRQKLNEIPMPKIGSNP